MGVDSVLGDLVELTRETDRGAVRKVAALVELHGEDLLSEFHVRKINRHVRLGARVGLYVRMLRAEEFFQPVTGKVLGHVMELAAAIVPLSRVTLGILVGHDRPHCLEHRTG